ncbi:MAG TPA: VRR-NUC domain-containing protein [Noviherbaspirillum sp.]|jgi:hypothetical protein|uniref:VRR-NUC domain-containing protein n=1 Tax=Noviherbaspirillum sp. TaxID=1926288 RepID=UPI002F928DC2
MARTLDNPFYYLDNFERAAAWIAARYDDLLDDAERHFLAVFAGLPQPSRALLVRMMMRKGPLFRASKLVYPELGETPAAAAPLVAAGLVDDRPLLDIDQLSGLLRKAEIAAAFPDLAAGRKDEQLAALRASHGGSRCFSEWVPGVDDRVYAMTVCALCDRLRLMFFGNLHQDWTEFVLADLGILRYEQVEVSPSSRGFGSRQDIDHYLQLHACRDLLEQGEAPAALLARVPRAPLANAWLEGRRQKLLFAIAQQHERAGAMRDALAIYAGCTHEGARVRAVRVLEKCEEHAQAHALAAAAWQAPESEGERQHLARILPRLRRRLGLPREAVAPTLATEEFTLVLPRPEPFAGVETAVRDHLSTPEAPVHYVENTLVNSLFGLLCWQAIFTPVPGAFFHPFHSGPADLHSADFVQRRGDAFDACLAQLGDGSYRATIRRNFAQKAGLQSPFVYWETLDEALLEQALACLPAAHLDIWFRRLLGDVRNNRAGMPDLIRFSLSDRGYEMIEVKGPGDRLQDNQLRWLACCAQHRMPVRVCYVEWAEAQ